MKKIKLMVASICTTVALHAGADPFTYHVGGYFGKNIADENSKMRNDSLYGIRGTVMLTSFYGLSIGYERIDKIDVKDSDKTVDVQRFYTQIEVDGEEQYHVVPYITFGLGYEMLSNDILVKGNKYDVSQFYASSGLGFRYNFIPELSATVEANLLWKTDTSDLAYNFVGGLVYHFNATTCDNTYVTQRLKEEPQEKDVIHTGSVNDYSGWNKGVKTKPKRRAAVVVPVASEQMLMTKEPTRVVKKLYRVKPVHHVKRYKKKRVSHVAKKDQGFYIMLGAYRSKQSVKKMISKLEKNHIAYLLKDNKNKGLTYVMAGTYPSRSEAQNNLHKLKKIQTDAYIAKMN